MQLSARVRYSEKIISLTRPYSLGNVLLITALAVAAGSFQLNVNARFIIACIVGILFWISCVFLLEFLHLKVDGRKKFFSKYLLLVPVAVLLGIFLILAPSAILLFIASFIAVILYSMKSKNAPLSHFAFIFRPFTEIGIVYSIALIYNYNILDPALLSLSILIYFISISRNVIGDIRDVNYDNYTIAKRLGTNITYLLGFIFLLLLFLANGLNYALIPLILIAILIVIRMHPFALHRIYILCSSFYFALLLISLSGNALLAVILLFISTMLNFTYNVTPRRSNREKPRWL
jgi:hypothetical protein